MSIYDSKLWISDLDETIATLPELEDIASKSLMVTGCTGLICSAVVDVLIRWNETHNDKIKILAAVRSEKKVKARFSHYTDLDWFTFVPYDASSTGNDLTLPCNYIIHGASNASPNKIVKEPVETMLSNIIGMKELLDYARKQGTEHGIKRGTEQGTKRVLYISTSEVYGRKEHDRPSKTDDYGWIDILNPRSSYSIGKCATETMCASYYDEYGDEYGVEPVIVRPGHVYGPTATESDNRVSSAWVYDVVRGKDIVMKSDGKQLRSYCYCLDCASAILKVLLKGESVRAYNISNPQSVISIKEMAEILAKVSGVKLRIEIPTDEEKKGFNPMNNSSLDSTELLSLGWKCLFDAERGFEHTVEIFKNIL